jgi:hypothetical protein
MVDIAFEPLELPAACFASSERNDSHVAGLDAF